MGIVRQRGLPIILDDAEIKALHGRFVGLLSGTGHIRLHSLIKSINQSPMNLKDIYARCCLSPPGYLSLIPPSRSQLFSGWYAFCWTRWVSCQPVDWFVVVRFAIIL